MHSFCCKFAWSCPNICRVAFPDSPSQILPLYYASLWAPELIGGGRGIHIGNIWIYEISFFVCIVSCVGRVVSKFFFSQSHAKEWNVSQKKREHWEFSMILHCLGRWVYNFPLQPSCSYSGHVCTVPPSTPQKQRVNTRELKDKLVCFC